MTTQSIFLPGEFHGQSSLVGYSSWGCKELDVTERLNSNNKKGMLDSLTLLSLFLRHSLLVACKKCGQNQLNSHYNFKRSVLFFISAFQRWKSGIGKNSSWIVHCGKDKAGDQTQILCHQLYIHSFICVPSTMCLELGCAPGTCVLAVVPACKELTLLRKSLSFGLSCPRPHHFFPGSN